MVTRKSESRMVTVSAKTATVPLAVRVHKYRSPRTVIGRFVARRTYRSAIFWAAIFCVYVLSKSSGYAAAYPTQADRAGLATTFGNNLGLNALLATPHQLNTVAGFVTWNTLSVTVIIGSIWALLLATRNFRGEEEAGRWEVLLGGQTTARAAAA